MSKIETQTEIIFFTYEDESFSEEQVKSELFYFDEEYNSQRVDKYGITPVVEFNAKRISRIDWSGGYIVFGSTNEREDIKQINLNKKCKSIDEMIVYDNTDNIIKKYIFEYDYFSNNCDLAYGKKYLCKRLKLQSIKETINPNLLPPYEFTYNTQTLPARNSYEQDYWGFYNANLATTFIPNIWAYPTDNNPSYLSLYSINQRIQYNGDQYHLMEGADRSPNSTVIESGILEKIKYPTGGYKEFYYEPHIFHFDGLNRAGGGIRIRKIIGKINADTPVFEKEYKYTLSENPSISSGKIIRLPEFAYYRSNFPGSINNIDDMKRATFISTSSVAGLDETQGSFVAYSEVSTIQIGNGKVVRKFHLPGTAEDIEDECQDGDCIYKRTTAKSTLGLYHCWPNYPFGSYSNFFSFKLGNFDKYPFAPNPNYDWNRGDIVEEIIYKEDDFINPCKKTIYDYSIKSFVKIPAIRCSFLGMVPNGLHWSCRDYYIIQNLDPPLTAHHYHFKFGKYYLLSAWKVLSSKSEFFYYENSSIEVNTTYDYDNPYHTQLTSKTIIGSNLNENVTVFEYPLDIQDPYSVYTTAEVIEDMNDKNMINYVLKTEEFNNTIMINGLINSFQFNLNNTNQILPESIYSLEGVNYNLKTSFIYDDKGNIIQSQNKDDIYITYLWGYDYSYPIAKIENATYDQVQGVLQYTYEELQNKTSSELLILFEELRQDNNLEKSFIYSYTYLPLIGMETETDPSGKTTYYYYDSFNRLETIKDHNGEIIKHIDYNYINADPYLSVDPTSINVEFIQVNEISIDVTSNVLWNVTVTPDDEWISVSPANGQYNDTFYIECEKNYGAEREGTVTVSGNDVPSKVIHVYQDNHP